MTNNNEYRCPECGQTSIQRRGFLGKCTACGYQSHWHRFVVKAKSGAEGEPSPLPELVTAVNQATADALVTVAQMLYDLGFPRASLTLDVDYDRPTAVTLADLTEAYQTSKRAERQFVARFLSGWPAHFQSLGSLVNLVRLEAGLPAAQFVDEESAEPILVSGLDLWRRKLERRLAYLRYVADVAQETRRRVLGDKDEEVS